MRRAAGPTGQPAWYVAPSSAAETGAIVPTNAVQRGAPGTFVYLVDPKESKVSVRKITLGPVDGEQVEDVARDQHHEGEHMAPRAQPLGRHGPAKRRAGTAARQP